MASVQQAYNSVFSSALAAAVTGSHAFRQSALGQRMTEIRSLESKVKQLDKAQKAYKNRTLTETEIQETEKLGEARQKTGLELTALTGDPAYAKQGLTLGTETKVKAEDERVKNIKAAEAAEAEEDFNRLSPSEQAEQLAAGALAEEITASLTRKRGGNI